MTGATPTVGSFAIYMDTRRTNAMLPLDEQDVRELIAERLRHVAKHVLKGGEGNRKLYEKAGGSLLGDWSLDLRAANAPVDHNADMIAEAQLEAQTREVYQKGIRELEEKLSESND